MVSDPFAGTLARWLLASALLHAGALLWLWQQPPLARGLPTLPTLEAPLPVRIVSRPAPAPPDVAAVEPPPVAPPDVAAVEPPPVAPPDVAAVEPPPVAPPDVAAVEPPPVAPPPPRPGPEPVARRVDPVSPPETPAPARTIAGAEPPPPAPAAVSAARAAPPGASAEDLLARYKALLLERIAAQKRYPALARRRGIEGDVTLRLRIDASGRLEAVETPGRSPRVLARQARSAAEDAAPFPPPPGGDFAIDFVLRFDLGE